MNKQNGGHVGVPTIPMGIKVFSRVTPSPITEKRLFKTFYNENANKWKMT